MKTHREPEVLGLQVCLIFCIKTDLGGHRVQLRKSLLLLLKEKGMTNYNPSRKKQPRKYSLQGGTENPLRPPRDFLPGRDSFWIPKKDIHTSSGLNIYIYPCKNNFLFFSFEYQSLSNKDACTVSNNGILNYFKSQNTLEIPKQIPTLV